MLVQLHGMPLGFFRQAEGRAMAAKVKCVNCGYLALRHHETRQLSEVEFGIRSSGKIPDVLVRDGIVGLYENILICLRRAHDLHAEHKDKGLTGR
jgi:hypothetical protein